MQIASHYDRSDFGSLGIWTKNDVISFSQKGFRLELRSGRFIYGWG